MTIEAIKVALDRLHEYSIVHPNHDTDVLVMRAQASLHNLIAEQKANPQKPPADGDGRMDIRSQGTVKGVIYNGIRYIRFSFFDEWLNEEFADWWIREPLDVLTKVRDRETVTTLNKAYSDATGI